MFFVKTYKKRFDANKVKIKKCGKHPYIVRTAGNNGCKGFIDEDELFLNEGNTISFGQDTATAFYQEKPYFTGDKIKILKCRLDGFDKSNAQFFVTAISRSFSSFSWGNSSYSIDVIENQKIQLPTRNTKIDFQFIGDFVAELEAQRVAELEAQRVAELEAYLTVTGLKDYNLTLEEEQALQFFSQTEWEEKNITEIFDVNNTKNILSTEVTANSGKTPYLCAGAENNSVSSYISYKEDLKEKGNCVFIGGKTFVVSYQECDFFSNDSHNLALYLKDKEKADKINQLYLVTCVKKGLSHKYSWGNSISNAKIQEDKIMIPIKNDAINYDIMHHVISAVKKLVIKDVVDYADRKIRETKKVIEKP